ncbi:hypothetical protein [Demequina gelatinilytica]|uniref:hypothetical protein n=1 Tax=Demequina gelatinilytica TaxID=1638980 RepID=UPI0007845D4F|nr:hypothetical protein [Demequina gelatinilytica]
MRSGDHVEIHLAYVKDVGIAGEWPWATAVDADEGGDTFCLENFLTMTPLVVGDLVRCQLGADSKLHVAEIVALLPGVLLGLTHPRDTEATVRPIAQELSDAGFAVNRPGDGFLQVWAGASPPHLVQALLRHDWPDGWEVAERLDAVGRITQIDRDIDLAPASSVSAPEGDTGYWAAEDPAWQRHGVSDPDTLSRLQLLAVEDPRVLATIRAGRHADVLTYMSRIAVRDPRLLPPLTRPLLVDPPGE